MVKTARTSVTVDIADVFDALLLSADFRDGIGVAVIGCDLVQLIHGRGLHDVTLCISTVRPNLFWKTGRVKETAVIKKQMPIKFSLSDSSGGGGGVHYHLQSLSRRSRVTTATTNIAAPAPIMAPNTAATRHRIVMA